MTRKGYKKHKKLIKLWEKGANIQSYSEMNKEWYDAPDPLWNEFSIYRIRPIKKIKLVVGRRYLLAYTDQFCHIATVNGKRIPYDADRYKKPYLFVGNFAVPEGKMNIFYQEEEGWYLMFSANYEGYIIKEIIE